MRSRRDDSELIVTPGIAVTVSQSCIGGKVTSPQGLPAHLHVKAEAV